MTTNKTKDISSFSFISEMRHTHTHRHDTSAYHNNCIWNTKSSDSYITIIRGMVQLEGTQITTTTTTTILKTKTELASTVLFRSLAHKE